MKFWLVPIFALGLLLGAALEWLFTNGTSTRYRRQLARQTQAWRKQGARTMDRLSSQVQEGAQEVVQNTRQLARRATRKLAG